MRISPRNAWLRAPGFTRRTLPTVEARRIIMPALVLSLPALILWLPTLTLLLPVGCPLAGWPLTGWPPAAMASEDPSAPPAPRQSSPRSAALQPEASRWMRYPAISPDGSTVAFSYRGDLYLASSEGGTARPATISPFHEFRPVWSPDGRWIAFASDRYGNYDVYLMSAAGGPARRLTFHSADDLPTGFTPDGGEILFSSARMDAASCILFPTSSLPELYSVSVEGGRPRRILTTPAEEARLDPTGRWVLYEDKKGYEDDWRKHHTSSIARDVWIHDTQSGRHLRVTGFHGEDRDPDWGLQAGTICFLSERGGTFNVWTARVGDLDSLFAAAGPEPSHPGLSLEEDQELELAPSPVTRHTVHPVRFLSVSDQGDLCYGYHGEIFIRPAGAAESRRLEVRMAAESSPEPVLYVEPGEEVTEMAVSPRGREAAFVLRGEIFVTALDHGVTRRITNTPEQERMVSFSPNGRSLVYAGERDGSWNIYRTDLADPEEGFFFNSTVLREEPVVTTQAVEFQPRFSPDGREIAFLQDRTELRVLNLESGRVRTVVPGDRNYSYSDGDLWYEWSPDSKWFLTGFLEDGRWSEEVGLIDAAARGPLFNLTRSAYEDRAAHWARGGRMVTFLSDREGMRPHGSWGSEDDVYALFLTREEEARFHLSQAEYELLRGSEDEADDSRQDGPDGEDSDRRRSLRFKPTVEPSPVLVDTTGIVERTARLTIQSAHIADARLAHDGEYLLYLAKMEEGYDLWSYHWRKKELKRLTSLDAEEAECLALEPEGREAFFLADGKMYKVDLEEEEDDGDGVEQIEHEGRMYLDPAAERAYIFEHAWRQTMEKFYQKEMHGVDWEFFKVAYRPFLPHINNNRDFAEMLSEMLGELNASHTGAGYVDRREENDATATLGLFYDDAWTGPGLRVLEVIPRNPVLPADTRIVPGTVITAIDGSTIEAGANPYPLLNHKAGRKLRIGLQDGDGKEWFESVRPITLREEQRLLYKRWIDRRRAETYRLSDGRLGYVHVQDMSDESFRQSFADILGRDLDKQALIVDTRFNAGGDLTEDLTTFLSGEPYFRYLPRGRHVGTEPTKRWNRPSIVLVCEGNYSDAHCFPAAYRDLGLGALVGMPVPGTCSSVWWETQQDPRLYFGIPQVGITDMDGNYLENEQLEPDYVVDIAPEEAAAGVDRQLKKAVEVLLEREGR